MLLRRMRVGLAIEDDQMKEFGIIQTPVPATPAPMTPGLIVPNVQTPVAPVVSRELHAETRVLDAALEEAQGLEDLQSVKEELLSQEEIEKQAENLTLFPLDLLQQGLIQIESSSGSDSDSSSYDSSDEVAKEPATFSHPRYTEDACGQRFLQTLQEWHHTFLL